MIDKLLLRRRLNLVRPMVTETGWLVQCKPVPDSLLGIKSYFSPVETPPAEGDKSPTNPSTISGWESVEVTRCGENLAPVRSDLLNAYLTTASIVNYDGRECIKVVPNSEGANIIPAYKETVLPLPSKLEQGVTVSFDILFDETSVLNRVYSYGVSKNIPSTTCYKNAWAKISSYNDLTPENVVKRAYLTLYPNKPYGGNPYTELYISNLQYSVGTTPTPYTPYQGDTYTATFPSEIGGGYVDWERGVLVETHRKLVFDGTEDWYAIAGHYQMGVGAFTINWWDGVTNVSHNGWWSEKEYNFELQPNGCSEIEGCGALLLLNGKTAFTTVSDFKTFLANENTAGTPVTVVYKLKTPIETTLSELSPIYAIDGINTIYSNAGDVEVTYKGAR